MKIQGPHQPGRMDRARPEPPAGPRGPATATGGEDAVELTSSAQALAAARAPETTDAARVDALRSAIADGTFRVEPRLIAEAMLREER